MTAIRPVRYPHRRKSQPTGLRKHRFNRARWRDDPGGKGSEIIGEAEACPSCANAWHGPETVEPVTEEQVAS